MACSSIDFLYSILKLTHSTFLKAKVKKKDVSEISQDVFQIPNSDSFFFFRFDRIMFLLTESALFAKNANHPFLVEMDSRD